MRRRTPPATVLALLLTLPLLAGCVAEPESLAPSAEPAPRYDPGWPALEDATLRPGDKLRAADVRLGVDDFNVRGCTVNFVFTSPDNRSLYVGTASHCLSPDNHVDGSQTPYRVGGAFTLGGDVRGVIAYCSWGAIEGTDECPEGHSTDPGHHDDFALIRIADEDRAKVHPALRHWGGPTGLLTETPQADAHVLTYGNSFTRDGGLHGVDVGDAREGRVMKANAWHTLVRFYPSSLHGDSGSPVITADGRALGIVQTLWHPPNETFGINGVVNLAAALDAMVARGGPEVRLATWPQLPEGVLPADGAVAVT